MSPTVIAAMGGGGGTSYYGVDDNTLEFYSQSGNTLMRLSTAWQDSLRKRQVGIRHTGYYSGIDAAVKGGGAVPISGDVYLCEANETVTDTMIFADDNLRIIGNKNYKLTVNKTRDYQTMRPAIWIRSDYSHVTIEGFEIDGNADTLNYCSFDAGIMIGGAQYVTIRNMYIHHTGGDAITINRDWTGSQPTRR